MTSPSAPPNQSPQTNYPLVDPQNNDNYTPNNGMFPLGMLDPQQRSMSMGFNRHFSDFSSRRMPETASMNTRETTMEIYTRHNLH
ncbi:hypothetical protein BASA50_000372 [Batrachochytrium salamandrivorans]|uniref:Uncharacterized protein n=1 Tax=Batrachochytrium salamandrivorans TaxID=1357716 RepID=A0ABQ8EU73_9FUNG|nr:hypothetical protein BASA60_010536 [Batrachochytrium salamandrivorans]KAH6586660.1 hypothetical protein BASA50_000372 [Batrachochytrium salamandrivorans]KAH6593691.1 hypothetical protein BASA61_004214 [Batrachochytrium salamandrivorans]KAH9275269.1 hypothetical protein BASA83_002504 [Batrachochytrium salamandrivorans]